MGAHRAGTAGISSLGCISDKGPSIYSTIKIIINHMMYLTGMNAHDAIQAEQARLSVIKPIDDFSKLLELLQNGMEKNRA